MAHLFDLIVALLLFQGVLPSWSSIQFRLWNFQLWKNICKEKRPQPSVTGKSWSTPLYELKKISNGFKWLIIWAFLGASKSMWLPLGAQPVPLIGIELIYLKKVRPRCYHPGF